MRGIRCTLTAVFIAALMVVPVSASFDSYADGGFTLTAVADHGTVVDVSTGEPFTSASVADSIELYFTPNSGHEFVEWVVEGGCKSAPDGPAITISELEEAVTVTAVSRNYSTSQELIRIVDSYGTPTPDDVLVNNWSFCSTSLQRTGDQWGGMPSTPLIVGNVAYVRAGGVLYALDISSGTIIKNVPSAGEVSFYHYLGYGNGVIFDTIGHKAYDLELNYLYSLPTGLRFASYHDGYFFGCIATEDAGYFTLYKTSADIDKDLNNGVKVNLIKNKEVFRIFNQYGQFSSVLFKNGYFFFLQADMITGIRGWRAMTAVNLETEVSTTIELSGFKGMPWDDGWLTFYNDYFYLTAYTAGLFDGVLTGLENKRSSLMWVKFDFANGTFGEPQYEEIKTTDDKTFRGIASGLEIYNGRGYVNVRSLGNDTLGGSDDAGSMMVAYNIGEDGRPIPDAQAPTVMTHGGIVVNTAHESEGRIYIYLLPYNMGNQGLYVFVDEYRDGKWQFCDRYTYLDPNSSITEYCSQAPRVGPDGEMIFFLDHGYVQCVKAASRLELTVTTIEGEHAVVQSECGKNASEVVSKLYPGCEVSGSTVTIGTKTYRMYGLNEVTWSYDELTDPVKGRYVGSQNMGLTDALYTQIALVEVNTENPHFLAGGETGWYYFGDTGFEKCNLRSRASLNAAMGCTLIYSTTKPSSDSAFLVPYMSVARGSVKELELPDMLESSYATEDGDIISLSRDGNTLSVAGLKEDVAKFILTVGGKDYEMTVDVLPKVTVVGNDTITESIRTRATADGGRTDSKVTVTSNSDGTATDSEVKTYDKSGNLVSTETLEKSVLNADISQFLDGQLAEVEEYERIVTDASDAKTVHLQYRKELISNGSQDGTLRTDIIEALVDLLTNTITKTETVQISNTSVNSTKVTVTVEKDDKVIEKTEQQDVESATKGVTAKVEGDNVVFDVTGTSTGDLSEMISVLDGSDGKSVKVNADSTLVSSILDSAAELGAELVMDTGSATISLGTDALNALKGKGDVTFTMAEADQNTMTQKQKDAAGGAKVFSIDLKCGDDYQHQFGRFVIEVECDIQTEDGKELKVWRIDDYGEKTLADDVSYEGGKLRFSADHLSYYAVGYDNGSSGTGDEDGGDSGGSGGSTMMFVGIGAAAVVILGIVAFAVIRRR